MAVRQQSQVPRILAVTLILTLFMLVSESSAGLFDDAKKGLEELGEAIVGGAEDIGGDIAEGAKDLADWFDNRAETLANSVRVEVGRGVETLKDSPAYQFLVGRALELFMEPPSVEVINPGSYPGELVYYVNGMLTVHDPHPDFQSAVEQAEALSDWLERPVGLIYNPTMLEGSTGSPQAPDDVSEAIYDRIWPETLGTGTIALGIPSFSFGPPFTQLNPTTRQVTHLIYHASRPITIVAHSQGTLITRNAIYTASLLGKEEWVRNRLTWAATGAPLGDSEIWPNPKNPKKFRFFENSGDCVAKLIGFKGSLEAEISRCGDFHEPTSNYWEDVANWLNALTPEDLEIESEIIADATSPTEYPEDGTSANPFRNLQAGVDLLRPGGTFTIKAGNYPGPLSIRKPMRIKAQGGLVRIGR